MNFIEIDKKLSHVEDALVYTCTELYARDIENRKYRIKKIQKKSISKISKKDNYIKWIEESGTVSKKICQKLCKLFQDKKGRFIVSNPRRIRIFAVCHPEELHLALGLCSKCYWKQYRDNAPPSDCHPNKKTFRKGLCKPCYRKLHPERKK